MPICMSTAYANEGRGGGEWSTRERRLIVKSHCPHSASTPCPPPCPPLPHLHIFPPAHMEPLGGGDGAQLAIVGRHLGREQAVWRQYNWRAEAVHHRGGAFRALHVP